MAKNQSLFKPLIPSKIASKTYAGAYRFAFNGKEHDDETYGAGNEYDLGARIYDPRLGRFFSRDPREKDYVWQSVYAYFSNNPVYLIDVNGEGGEDKTQTVKSGDCPSVIAAKNHISLKELAKMNPKNFQPQGALTDEQYWNTGKGKLWNIDPGDVLKVGTNEMVETKTDNNNSSNENPQYEQCFYSPYPVQLCLGGINVSGNIGLPSIGANRYYTTKVPEFPPTWESGRNIIVYGVGFGPNTDVKGKGGSGSLMGGNIQFSMVLNYSVCQTLNKAKSFSIGISAFSPIGGNLIFTYGKDDVNREIYRANLMGFGIGTGYGGDYSSDIGSIYSGVTLLDPLSRADSINTAKRLKKSGRTNDLIKKYSNY